jgi:hypothetical protein
MRHRPLHDIVSELIGIALTEAVEQSFDTLLSRNLEPLNPAVSLPELYVVIVHNFPSVVFGAFIVWAEKPNHPAKLPVCSNDAHLIFDH